MSASKEKVEIEDFSNHELITEIEHRGLEDHWEPEPSLSDFTNLEIKAHLEDLGYTVLDRSDDKDQIIEKYYNEFKWTELNHILKTASNLKKSGYQLKEDFSLLDDQVIS